MSRSLPPTRRISAAPDVVTIVGAAEVRAWQEGPYPTSYECQVCGEQATVDDGTPTTVIVAPVADIPGATGVLWAHETCAPSQVLDDAAIRVDEQDVMVTSW